MTELPEGYYLWHMHTSWTNKTSWFLVWRTIFYRWVIWTWQPIENIISHCMVGSKWGCTFEKWSFSVTGTKAHRKRLNSWVPCSQWHTSEQHIFHMNGQPCTPMQLHLIIASIRMQIKVIFTVFYANQMNQIDFRVHFVRLFSALACAHPLRGWLNATNTNLTSNCAWSWEELLKITLFFPLKSKTEKNPEKNWHDLFSFGCKRKKGNHILMLTDRVRRSKVFCNCGNKKCSCGCSEKNDANNGKKGTPCNLIRFRVRDLIKFTSFDRRTHWATTNQRPNVILNSQNVRRNSEERKNPITKWKTKAFAGDRDRQI